MKGLQSWGTRRNELERQEEVVQGAMLDVEIDLIQSKEYLGSNCSEEGPGLGAAGGSKKTEITIDISIGLNKASQNTASYINSFNPHSTFT